MTSRNLLNLVLLAIVASLIAIVAIEPGKTPEAVNPKLTALKQDDINHILIQRDTGADIELEKIEGVWQMLKPYKVRAHDFRVQSVLRLAEAESFSQNNLADLNKKTFGLDKSRVSVVFNKNIKALFGSNEPLQQHRYIQIGNVLHTIIDTFYYQVAARLTTFVDHGLLAGEQDISKLELPELTVELQGGKWQVTPEQQNISADSISDLLNNWRNSQAIEIRETPQLPAMQTATIYVKDSDKPIIFHIRKEKDNTSLVRKDIGLEYVVTEDNLNKLLSLSVTSDNSDNAE
jgi:hypothetical protein